MRLVLIDWVDSYGCSSNWASLDDCAPEPMTCRSVGWLVHDGPDSKTVVPHIATKPAQGCGDMTIPTVSIKRMVDLGDP